MQDFILEAEVKITAKPVAPKTGLKLRGPYERNLFVVREASKSHFYGTKANIATMVANAIKPISRQWSLLASAPARVLALPPSAIYDEGADLEGRVHDGDVSTAVAFMFGTDPDNLSATAADETPVTGDEWHVATLEVDDLLPETQYYYRVRAVSAGGTIYSNLMSFQTTDNGSVRATPTPTPTA